jgi:hypothetical protein
MPEQIRTKAGTNYLTEAEERKLFITIKGRKGRQAERDFVLLKLCRATALRRGETLALNVEGQERIVIDERIRDYWIKWESIWSGGSHGQE